MRLWCRYFAPGLAIPSPHSGRVVCGTELQIISLIEGKTQGGAVRAQAELSRNRYHPEGPGVYVFKLKQNTCMAGLQTKQGPNKAKPSKRQTMRSRSQIVVIFVKLDQCMTRHVRD